jgi:AraC-like DNA-binding protein
MPPVAQHDIQQRFFRENPSAENVIKLFEFLPHVLFFAKDSCGRFIKANPPFLESLGVTCEDHVIGKTARDFHPPVLAEAYMADDDSVMSSGQAKPGEIWLMLHRRREPRWYIETKVPLVASNGQSIGIVGTMYRIERQDEFNHYLHELSTVALYIEKHFAESISMADMAEMAGISSTQFNRRFRQLLRMTPMEYLRTVRIQAAQKLLITTRSSLVQISAAVGYADQSHFTKRFRQITGMTPAAYRKRFVS